VPPLLLVLAAFALLPDKVGSQSFVDLRVPVAALFLLIAATDVSVRRRALGRAAVALLVGLGAARVGGIAWQWSSYRPVEADYRAAFSSIEPGGTLFVAEEPPDHAAAGVPPDLLPPSILAVLGDRPGRLYNRLQRTIYVHRLVTPPHIDALAAIGRPVFVPTIFAEPWRNPLVARERFSALRAAGWRLLRAGTDEELAAVVGRLAAVQAATAPGRPAYLLVLAIGSKRLSVPAAADLVRTGGHFRLLRLRAPPG
jgi:hypothetical protein